MSILKNERQESMALAFILFPLSLSLIAFFSTVALAPKVQADMRARWGEEFLVVNYFSSLHGTLLGTPTRAVENVVATVFELAGTTSRLLLGLMYSVLAIVALVLAITVL